MAMFGAQTMSSGRLFHSLVVFGKKLFCLYDVLVPGMLYVSVWFVRALCRRVDRMGLFLDDMAIFPWCDL